MGWLTGYSKQIKGSVVATAAGAQTNFQMKLLVGESSGASGEDVDCESHCQDFPNDIRFTGADGTTKHDYWVESLTGTTPNRLATIWIEVATIPASGSIDFYMYYGKSGDSGDSDFDDTFVFGELWDNASLDTGKWPTVTCSPTYTINIANHYLEVTDVASPSGWCYGEFRSKTLAIPDNFILEDAYSENGVEVWNENTFGNNIFYNKLSFPGMEWIHNDNWAGTCLNWFRANFDGVLNSYPSITSCQVFDRFIKIWRLSGIGYIEDSGATKSGSVANAPTYFTLLNYSYSSYPFAKSRYYAFKIRKYSSPEPTWGTWGGEVGARKTRSYAYIIG